MDTNDDGYYYEYDYYYYYYYEYDDFYYYEYDYYYCHYDPRSIVVGVSGYLLGNGTAEARSRKRGGVGWGGVGG